MLTTGKSKFQFDLASMFRDLSYNLLIIVNNDILNTRKLIGDFKFLSLQKY